MAINKEWFPASTGAELSGASGLIGAKSEQPTPVQSEFGAVEACCAIDDRREKATMLQAKAQILVSHLVRADGAPGATAYIIAPKLDLEIGVVAGVTERSGSEPLTTAHPVRISSVTKPFVAAAILRLWEMGQIELAGSIDSYLPIEHTSILTNAGYDAKAITVRHLLSHTAGLRDVFHTDAFAQMLPGLMSGQVRHCFTLEEQLQMAMEGGRRFPPGEAFEYSDTGYLLLGAILGKVTGKSMAAATRQLVRFDRLGLESTWWEVLELEREGVLTRAHQYEYACGWDSYDEDPPHDLFGGGGMISTPRDLATFFHALFHGKVFERPETIHVMISVAKTTTFRNHEDDLYGHGPQIHNVGDLTVYAHGGWWGLDVGYVPELDMTLSVVGLRRDIRPRYSAVFDELILEAARLHTKR
ncbi:MULTISPECIES: serine hydrolase [Rhizobium]|uniref:serine hydrolase domain-containing protein n=1 Tax=Rhizobium TaxID=379 RepID=UPI001A996EB1|nr:MULTISPECIES: serine hydrolase domain-containing protein [Rhizobium]MBX4893903.1 beta-lactamase family protein [Rhizobium bangladeshense]MBX4935264.1 beta-lactamase family protein [Rhizobium bangladeshense]MBX5242884.1 beta-lactamase family protein [Rhizobium sp. NLR22b]QSY91951.1 beta-lactamase family protein [Rhizobium bangladeshense]